VANQVTTNQPGAWRWRHTRHLAASQQHRVTDTGTGLHARERGRDTARERDERESRERDTGVSRAEGRGSKRVRAEQRVRVRV